jgi:hypothetical protein
VVLRKRLVVLLMALVLALMPAAPAMADPGFNNGNKDEDGLDANQGGGQEKSKHEHPPHAGGDQHGGGIV